MNQEQITDGITITFDGRDSVHIDMWLYKCLTLMLLAKITSLIRTVILC
jgi:hypothetical protein